jgi:hypothetical protein
VDTRTGESFLELHLHNEGKRHQVLQNVRLLETRSLAGARDLELPPATLKPMEGQNILAGHRRRFLLPLVKGQKPLPAKLEVQFD